MDKYLLCDILCAIDAIKYVIYIAFIIYMIKGHKT